MQSSAADLLRELGEVDEAIASLQRATQVQERYLRLLQAPLLHVRQRAASAGAKQRSSASATAAGAVFHAQLLVGHAPLGTPAPTTLATAHVNWHAAAGASVAAVASSAAPAWPAGAGSSQSQQPAVLLHVLLSNQNHNSVETDPSWMQLLVQMRVVPAAASADEGAAHVSSLCAPFPSARWAPRATFQATLPIDAQLLNHACVQVRVAMRLRKLENDSGHAGFVDVLLGEWVLDALDASTPVLLAPVPVPSLKRKREPADNADAEMEEQKSPTVARAQAPGSINQLHQRALRAASAEETRVLHVPSVSLVGSVYSTPSWFALHLPSPAVDRRLVAAAGASAFSLAFAIPLLLDAQHMFARGPVIHAFVRMLLSFLLPAHSLAFTEAVIGALLPAGAFEAQPAAGARATNASVRFVTRVCGESVEWMLDVKPPHGSITQHSTLFTLRLRCPSTALLPTLRRAVLQRLHKALFRSGGVAPAVASPSAPSLPLSSGVSLRKPAHLSNFGTGAQMTAANEARKWCISYMRVHSTPSPQATWNTAATSVSPLAQHVRALHAHLRRRVRTHSQANGAVNGSKHELSSSKETWSAYAESRGLTAQADDAEGKSESDTAFGSVHTLVC